jgi:hypothetical protein
MGPLLFLFFTSLSVIVYYTVCDKIFECRHVEDILLILLYDLLVLCNRHVSFKSLRSRDDIKLKNMKQCIKIILFHISIKFDMSSKHAGITAGSDVTCIQSWR